MKPSESLKRNLKAFFRFYFKFPYFNEAFVTNATTMKLFYNDHDLKWLLDYNDQTKKGFLSQITTLEQQSSQL
jgi:hypothetical protein